MEMGYNALREQATLTIQDNDPYGVSTSDMPVDLMYFGPIPKARPKPPRSYKGLTTGPQKGTKPATGTRPPNRFSPRG